MEIGGGVGGWGILGVGFEAPIEGCGRLAEVDHEEAIDFREDVVFGCAEVVEGGSGVVLVDEVCGS